jgi:hypothetical protein
MHIILVVEDDDLKFKFVNRLIRQHIPDCEVRREVTMADAKPAVAEASFVVTDMSFPLGPETHEVDPAAGYLIVEEAEAQEKPWVVLSGLPRPYDFEGAWVQYHNCWKTNLRRVLQQHLFGAA